MEKTGMIFANLFIGLLFIGLGFFAKWAVRYPFWLAGYYSSMPKEKKKNVDFDGLSVLWKKGFIILGITWIVLSFILQTILFEGYALLIISFVILIGIMIIVLKGKKYDYNTRENNNFNIFVYTYFGIILIIVLLLFGTIVY